LFLKNCDFTKANISRTNFQGAQIGVAPLRKHLPGWENIKLQLAKNLRQTMHLSVTIKTLQLKIGTSNLDASNHYLLFVNKN